MSTHKQAKKRRAQTRKEKYGIQVEPIFVNGKVFNCEEFMMKHSQNKAWREEDEWKQYKAEVSRRQKLSEETRTAMVEEGLDTRVRNLPTNQDEKLEQDKHYKTVSSALDTISALGVAKEMAKQQIDTDIWNTARRRQKFTPEQKARVSPEVVMNLINSLVKIAETELKVIGKIHDPIKESKARLEAQEEFKRRGRTIQQLDFKALNNLKAITEESEDIDQDKVKNILSGTLN